MKISRNSQAYVLSTLEGAIINRAMGETLSSVPLTKPLSSTSVVCAQCVYAEVGAVLSSTSEVAGDCCRKFTQERLA